MFEYPRVRMPMNITLKKVLILSAFIGALSCLVNGLFFYSITKIFHLQIIVVLPFVKKTLIPVMLDYVIVASFIPAPIAGIVLWFIHKGTRFPIRIFSMVSVAVFFISLAFPFSLHVAPMVKISLACMHALSAACIIICFANIIY